MIRLLQRWLNCPPEKDARYITDKYGVKFWISWSVLGRLNRLHTSYQGKSVGLVDLFWENPPELILSNLEIFQHSKMRGRGLSKPMLQEAIRWAKENGASVLWGWIQPGKGTTEEQLIELYRSKGFTLTTNEHGKLIFEMVLTENAHNKNGAQPGIINHENSRQK